MDITGDLQAQLIRTAVSLNSERLSVGTAGNVSVRAADGFWVTPSGVPSDQLRVGDLVHMSMQGSYEHRRRAPSSEWRIHLDIYRQKHSVNAIVHAHPRYATALACTLREIPAFHYMVAIAGGDSIRCAPYATFGTQQLSDNVLDALHERKVCLMANHGMMAVGADLSEALDLAIQLEAIAAQYCEVLKLGGQRILDDQEMRRVREKFKSYGMPRGNR